MLLTRRLLVILFAVPLFAQSESGELRLKVVDSSGFGLQSSVELVSEANQFQRTYATDSAGNLVARRLPFGLYWLKAARAGFSPKSVTTEIRSAIPSEIQIQLSIEALRTEVKVQDSATLIDPHRTGALNRIGTDTITHAPAALPGRLLIDLVDSEPGWLLESNGVLHPRGSEYQTQYVLDGVPLTDNRSPAFAAPTETGDVQSMTVLTAGIPAEFGRKLGGIVEISTSRDPWPGLHGDLGVSGGSFGTGDASLLLQNAWGKNTLGMSAEGAFTGRYLDPPVLANFTNRATISSFASRYERDFTSRDRLGLIVRHEQAGFRVPNEYLQQAAGQRQDRDTAETMGILSFQHIVSPQILVAVRAMARDDSSGLFSNGFSTPVVPGQQRGIRQGYVAGSVSAHRSRHEVKAGADFDYGSIHERFHYTITDASQFDPGTPPLFSFAGHGLDREEAAYVQDMIRAGPWTFSAGLRLDHYQFVVEKTAFSPRFGVAWYWPRMDAVFHASYDRAFQTPAAENLLLASSPAVLALNPQVLRLPVEPSHGNFYEAGLTKGFAGKLRLDLNYYDRSFDNFADDDLLLNTGVSFPIAFRKGNIYGAEAKAEIPAWGRFSGYVSYSYMVGFGYTPVTGGLFLGEEATSALDSSGRFPVSQDQRNTISTRFRYQISSRIWAAMGGSYGSGLPTEFDGTVEQAVQQFGSAIVNRVNLDRGRVRPSLSLDASAGAELIRHDRTKVTIQADIENLNDRVNVINFAGLFSGTGIAPPRSYQLRLQTYF